MEGITNNSINAALNAGAASVQPVTSHGGIPFVVVPNNYGVRDIERLLPTPPRKRCEVTTADADSFIFYMKKHGSYDTAMIYADINNKDGPCFLTGVLNDHGSQAGDPGWRDHLCRFSPKESVEWKRWLGSDKKQFSQDEFAVFLEDNSTDIAIVEGMPTGSDILQMALGFEANSGKRFRSKINLQNGCTQFEFVEDEERDTRVKMQVFERFVLGLPVFDGSISAYSLGARLKYRESEGKVKFWYELIRPDKVFKAALADDLERIREQTGFSVIYGSP
jgi:uncharacterized protein YfdQ (DUF2303 family)